ncbi:shikimate dehydrogenase [Fuchsiella alkaliacetigena]|uniref:shikimate dehydrogenase n=1 Tax=Fuchsiella alkaliacetigena TaxID=957042 RepID=UPI00200A0DA3|nr:shikimate dehydrogenase [Fuchsiella alkaliacetigena]MCK8825277.1 shikimate dehydrogenase [Fuchsiella alkaliacetigena]
MITELKASKLMEVKLTGLFGYPVEHSLSPVMHNTAFKELGLDYLYLPFAVPKAKLAEAVAGIKGLNFEGVNLTIPHKQKVRDYLDELSQEAELIGAVNTVQRCNGKLIGHNTDGKGFLRSLVEEASFTPQDKKVLVIGAGGAARAVSYQLALEEVKELYIANRTLSKAENLATEVGKKLDLNKAEALPLEKGALSSIIKNLDLVVDTTPIGMSPQVEVEPVIEAELLHSNLLVADLVYNPVKTTLLKAAQKAGAETLSGLGMLVYQGAIAFEIWTGQRAPVKVMKEVVQAAITE